MTTLDKYFLFRQISMTSVYDQLIRLSRFCPSWKDDKHSIISSSDPAWSRAPNLLDDWKLFTYPSVQCAAVRTKYFDRIVPPQYMIVLYSVILRATWCGNVPNGAFWPFTILPWPFGFLRPSYGLTAFKDSNKIGKKNDSSQVRLSNPT